MFVHNFYFLSFLLCNFIWKNSGVAIGSGWQAVVAYVNLASFYVIGLTVGCVLGFQTTLGVAVSSKHFW